MLSIFRQTTTSSFHKSNLIMGISFGFQRRNRSSERELRRLLLICRAGSEMRICNLIGSASELILLVATLPQHLMPRSRCMEIFPIVTETETAVDLAQSRP